ncbi:amino acid adenylation domain-containing protein, partial [Bradyrhizobium sp. SZCCHNS1012]|uniref:amino acid adenylation domain-containing protein n=1 Tax=Bradyrhizobium sp. SZCCHNS1012 TaxID=3057297 RepID=UPI002916B8A8
KYDAELYEPSTIARMADHYLRLLNGIIEDPDRCLGRYPLLTKAEEQAILVDWNATEVGYPQDQCVHTLFEQQVLCTPDAVAVRYEDRSLSYRALDARSEGLAIHLQGLGACPDQLIGVCIERSLDLMVGLLGVLKSGGAYVPLDPDHPDERLRVMLEDSRPSLVVTQRHLASRLRPLLPSTTRVVALDEEQTTIFAPAVGVRRAMSVTAENLAYVIYTSGSTGRPKGVMVRHRGLTNVLTSFARYLSFSSHDVLLAVTTPSFDIAGLELYLPIIQGAQCVIVDAETARNVEKLRAALGRIKPTVMQATPTTWSMLFQGGWRNAERLKILCGGEALPAVLKEQIAASGSEALNLYGPTETTIWSTLAPITTDTSISIGTPIANTQVYVLANDLQPLPVMVPGELHIGGDGVAKGYLNQPDLTAEKFIDNPFRESAKLYKTGDLARWRPDGRLEYLGRIDTQVKIRGYRIELSEIEAKLAGHPEIRDCAVVAWEDNGRKQLIAYYVGNDLSSTELRSYLKTHLPYYMVPSHFIALDRLPSNSSGKIDRRALIARPLSAALLSESRDHARRSTAIESQVLAIWRDILRNDDIGLEDGFFDVGGDSLLALTVADRIAQTFDCEFDVTGLFKYGTIRNISQNLPQVSAVAGEAAIPAVAAAPLKQIPTQGLNGNCPEYYQRSVAIIGISCQFPGANNHQEFWENLRRGKESMRFLGEDELRRHGIPQAIIRNKNYVPVRSAIEGKDLFDPRFFKFSPRDAELLDPQLRLLLQHAWTAVEDAGYAAKDIPETSVFMSASHNGYGYGLARTLPPTDAYLAWVLAQGGTIPTVISNKLNLKGPSYSVHSNCSSSLVGLYAACQALALGESKYALVGASTLRASESVGHVAEPGMNFSSDGHIKAFDAAADGMVGAEGVAVILVKPALDAIADGDHIYAIIRGVGLNNDGAEKAGFYAPSVRGQGEVIDKVLRSTGVDPRTISYVEAHGTGTKLGDPIEFAALHEVYTRYTSDKQYCGLGSVKTNVGHLDTAAGLAGCIKLALSLEHREMVPTLNYSAPNPSIDLENSPFYVVQTHKRWDSDDGAPRRAALSSFGIGGTNTHAILEEAPTTVDTASLGAGACIVPLSARNAERLQDYARSLLEFLERRDEASIELRALAYTLQIGREAMTNRVVFVSDSIAHLKQQLLAFLAGKKDIFGCMLGEASDVERHGIVDADDTKVLVEKWSRENNLYKIAGAWARGFDTGWSSLWGETKPRRISLPTYPFARERYWVPAAAPKMDDVG